jgi:hypothetical protein
VGGGWEGRKVGPRGGRIYHQGERRQPKALAKTETDEDLGLEERLNAVRLSLTRASDLGLCTRGVGLGLLRHREEI